MRDTGRVIWHTTMSLDGYIADPDEQMDWAFESGGASAAMVDDVVGRLGALLVGRRTMGVEDTDQPGFYGGAFTGPFFVLTHDTDAPPPVVAGVEGRRICAPITDAVATALAAANGKDVGLLGAHTATQALEAGLLDELIVHVAPVLLGAGTPLHRGGRHRLVLEDASRDGALTTTRFTVAEPAAEREA